MRRDVFSDEHDHFRAEFRRFAAAEIAPRISDWNANGLTDRATWKRCGEQGFLGASQPEEYGGGGDFLYEAVIIEEVARIRAHALMRSLHSDICMPYLTEFGTEAQKQTYLVPSITGDCLLAIVVAKTDTDADPPHRGISLLLVEAGSPGFERGRTSRRSDSRVRTRASCSSATAGCLERTSSDTRDRASRC